MTLTEFISNYGSFAGLLSLILGAFFVFYYRRKDVTDAIDKENLVSQAGLLTTLREENAYLKSQNLLKDEKIKNLETLLQNQKDDFQRQIDQLSKQIIEIKNTHTEVAGISTTLQMFVPLLKDVQYFKESHSTTLAKLDQVLKKLHVKP